MKVHHLSTFGQTCGIGNYSADLSDALERSGIAVERVPLRTDHLKYTPWNELGNWLKQIIDQVPDRSLVHVQHEHGFNNEDDEQHRDQVELDAEALTRIAEHRHAGLIGGELDRGEAIGGEDVRNPKHQEGVGHHEGHDQKHRDVGLQHGGGLAREFFHLGAWSR